MIYKNNQIGNTTELKLMAEFSRLGYTVSLPYGGNTPYDFIVDLGNFNYIRVQSKTACSLKDGSGFMVRCRCSHRSGGKRYTKYYTKEDCDYIATVFGENYYLIPITSKRLTDITLKFPETKNKNKCGISTDYELEKILKDIMKDEDDTTDISVITDLDQRDMSFSPVKIV